nr:MAG TPA: hypothetical protein [Caudoviricetes sp.]
MLATVSVDRNLSLSLTEDFYYIKHRRNIL